MANKIQLGSGDRLLDGWKNYDIDTKGGALPLNLEEPLPFEDESADKILIVHTLCLIKRKEQLVREMLRVLKKGGVLEILDNPVRWYAKNEKYRDEHSEPRANLLEWLKGTDVFCIDDTEEYPFSEELERARNNHKSFYIKAIKL